MTVAVTEPVEALSPSTRDLHRAILSLMEELEAIDLYRQRADVSGAPELREILLHNRTEEIEHASMLLEWIRRNDTGFDEMLRKFLFRSESVAALEAVPPSTD